MIVVRRDLFASNGQWIYAYRNGCLYLGDDLLEALILIHKLHPNQPIYLDDREFWGNDMARWRQRYATTREPGELKLVEFINE
jgi:hypothetical protein